MGVTFSGTAFSVNFGGVANQTGFDNITLGSDVPEDGGGPPPDIAAPVVSAPAPLTVECSTTGGTPTSNAAIQAWLASATANDNVDGALTPSNDLVNGLCAVGTTKTVTFSATDAAGNTGSATSTITVVDTTDPTVSCPAGTSASADGNCQAPIPDVTASVAASDTCSASNAITITQSPAAGTLVGLGTHTITVTGTDAAGNSSSCTTTLTVTDDTPPTVSCAAGTAASADGNCEAPIPDVTASVATSDNCSGVSLTQSPAAGTLVGLGVHTITVTGVDAAGNSSICTTTFTVTDDTDPTINSASASPDELWPPNHKMREVTVSVDVSDNCDAAVECVVTSVESDEPINGQGDGNISPDWEIIGDLTVDLRAERSGLGGGRVYTINLLCTDDSGNTSTSSVEVNVPHDKGKKK